MVIDDAMKEELVLRFKSLLSYENLNDKHREEIKENNKSAKETIKALADKLEVKQKNIKQAFKEYKKSIEEKEDFDEKESVFAMIVEYGLLK